MPDSAAVIDELYDAALGVSPWPAALESVARLFTAEYAGIHLENSVRRQTSTLSAGAADPSYMRAYESHFWRLDPILTRAAAQPARTILTDQSVIAKQDLLRTEFFQDWARPQGFYSVLAGNLLREREFAGLIVISRDRRRGEFERDSLDELQTLFPHLRRAVQISVRLAQASAERDATFAALDRLAQGVFILNPESRVIFANRAAEELLARADGIDHGPLGISASAPAETNRLRELVARAADTGERRAGGALSLSRPSQSRPLQALISPLSTDRAWADAATRAAAVFMMVIDPEKELSASEAALRSLYGLTRAEAKVSLAVAAHDGLQAAAAALGVSASTIRTHLQHVFEKTGTGRQSELTRLLEQIASIKDADEAREV